jgi:hypothetical protein
MTEAEPTFGTLCFFNPERDDGKCPNMCQFTTHLHHLCATCMFPCTCNSRDNWPVALSSEGWRHSGFLRASTTSKFPRVLVTAFFTHSDLASVRSIRQHCYSSCLFQSRDKSFSVSVLGNLCFQFNECFSVACLTWWPLFFPSDPPRAHCLDSNYRPWLLTLIPYTG